MKEQEILMYHVDRKQMKMTQADLKIFLDTLTSKTRQIVLALREVIRSTVPMYRGVTRLGQLVVSSSRRRWPG